MRHLPPKPGIADSVLNFEVLEQLPGVDDDAAVVIQDFRRIPRFGGILPAEALPVRRRKWRHFYVRSPSWKEALESVRKEQYKNKPLSARHLYRDEELEKTLRQTGFKLQTRTYGRILPAGLVELHPWLARLEIMPQRIPVMNIHSQETTGLADKGMNREALVGGEGV